MKRIVSLMIVGLVSLILVGCAPPLLQYEEQLPSLKASADKALCVVLRPTDKIGSMVIPIYVDENLISGTLGNTITSFDVGTGEHLVIAKSGTTDRVKFNFQAGKVYYLREDVWPLPLVVNGLSLEPISADEATALIEQEKGKLKYVERNPKCALNNRDNLGASKVQSLREDWQKWADKNPEKAKKQTEYPGY